MYNASGAIDKQDYLVRYAPLVKRIAHHMIAKLPASVEVDDLIQAGMIGLLDAITRYEEAQGAQFETYAVQRIRGAMLDELRQADWLPRSVRRNMRRIEAAMSKLEQNLGRSANEQEVARALEMPLAEYQQMLQEARGHQLIYYEDFNDDDDGENFLDRHCMDDKGDPLSSLIEGGLRQVVVEAIEKLPERERQVMGMYYEQELNLKEIGAVLGVSESRICQLHSQAVARLRARLKEVAWTSTA